MRSFAQACEEIAGTTKKLEKVAIVADLLTSLSPENSSAAAVFLSGRPFPVWEETTLQVGGTLLWRVVAELSGKPDAEMSAAYRRFGDLGAAAEELLRDVVSVRDLSLSEVENRFRAIASAKGPTAKRVLVRELLSQVTPLEAKYIIKIMTGDLRIGLKESLVEKAIAKAFGLSIKEIQRANMLLGDIGQTLQLAGEARLGEARMRLFHPLGFMLASPADSAEDALGYFDPALVEHKYDGIRAQVHCSPDQDSGDQVKIFSRTRDDITESFPELADALAGLPQEAILDGEILAWNYETEGSGRALPFRVLATRIGRKKVSEQVMREVPVAYLAFDLLYVDGELLIDRPLSERGKLLSDLLAAPRVERKIISTEVQAQFEFQAAHSEVRAQILRAPVFQASTPAELDKLFDAAQAEGNEGLMIKDPASLYSPGKRGKSWLKLKRELATLDVVVTAVEYGHGKRAGVLSDYTFAVRDGVRLVNIGKAYSGLTDVEIAEMTDWFLGHTIDDQGYRRIVDPTIVIEVAFNNMMISDRHESGYALRFPRIVRLRPDKLPEDADTIERAREIYEGQKN
jgi:DNA ligase-1